VVGEKKKKLFSSLGKLRVIYIGLRLLNLNMTTNHPPVVREKSLKPKTTFLI
jgi:hypothetical protein